MDSNASHQVSREALLKHFGPDAIATERIDAETMVSSLAHPDPALAAEVKQRLAAGNLAAEPHRDKEAIEDLFRYHAPTPDQVVRLASVREAAKGLAYAIDASCPASADRTAAMRQLQDTVMTANRSIVLDGRSYR